MPALLGHRSCSLAYQRHPPATCYLQIGVASGNLGVIMAADAATASVGMLTSLGLVVPVTIVLLGLDVRAWLSAGLA